MAKPEKSFRIGAVQCAIWANEREVDGEKKIIHSVTINKSYKDKNTGEWKQTQSFTGKDIADASKCFEESYIYLFKKDNEFPDDNEPTK